jgi:hypothetical protein
MVLGRQTLTKNRKGCRFIRGSERHYRTQIHIRKYVEHAQLPGALLRPARQGRPEDLSDVGKSSYAARAASRANLCGDP